MRQRNSSGRLARRGRAEGHTRGVHISFMEAFQGSIGPSIPVTPLEGLGGPGIRQGKALRRRGLSLRSDGPLFFNEGNNQSHPKTLIPSPTLAVLTAPHVPPAPDPGLQESASRHDSQADPIRDSARCRSAFRGWRQPT